MANEEHLEILRQGVEVWNQWRINNFQIVPDLSEANLSYTYLIGADLNRADLSRTDLRYSNFMIAKLIAANLENANLISADFNGADLSGANLQNADLQMANFSAANFNSAIVSGANLQNTSLQAARLINANLDNADLTNACLWETQRAKWSIKGVICKSVYWDSEAEKKSFYAPGEFERLFAEQTKIRLFYKDGISPLEIATLPALIQHLSDSHPGSNLRFVSIHEDGGGAVVELAIEGTDNLQSDQVKQLQTTLTTKAQELVEARRLALTERETRLQLEGEVKQLNSMVDKLLDRTGINIKNKGKINMSEDKGDKYINKGQVGAMGDNAESHHNTFTQNVNPINQSMVNSPGGIQAGRDVTIHQAPQPRQVTIDQNEKIVRILRANPSQSISVLAITGDREASDYAALIAQVLDNGGWQVNFVPFVHMMTPTPYGIQCRIADANRATTIYSLLQTAFSEGNIDIINNPNPIADHPTALLIGLKP